MTASTRRAFVAAEAVAARVVAEHPHPNADLIRIAVVEAGERRWRVVYGGTRRLTVGDVVPVATPGTKLTAASRLPPLRARNFRGVRSEAMLCSSDELGWTRGGPDEVLVLDPGHEVGVPVRRPSGRCHGPGCTQTAVVEYWCGERCQHVWAAQFGDPTPKMSRVRLDAAVARLDAEDAADARAASARVTVRLTSTPVEVIDDPDEASTEPSALRLLVDNVPPAMLAIGASTLGAGAAIAKAAEVERLNDRLRRAFPDHADEALAEARRRAHSSFATYAQAVESMWSYPPEFASANAENQLVASHPDPSRGWLSRWFDRLFGRTT